MKWIFLFSLLAQNSFSAIWIPHEKEIWGIIRRAEKTPEMLIEFRYPGIEKLNVDRRYELLEGSCPQTSYHFKSHSPQYECLAALNKQVSKI